jgi:6-phosphogluconolactonase
MKTTDVKLKFSIAAGSKELAQETVELFIGRAQKAIDIRGRFCVAISRQTPNIFFELLGSDSRLKSLPWNQIHLFCVDECCGTSDLDNNYNQLLRTIAETINIPSENVHRICSECQLCELNASIYEQTLQKVLRDDKNGVPGFDLILLNMESDGHIASLFPDTYAFFESEKLVSTIYFMDDRHTRITMTHPVLYAASHIAVLVSGGEKAKILSEIFAREPNISQYPVHALWSVLDKVTWLVDRNAARLLMLPYRIEMRRCNSDCTQQCKERRHIR